MLAPDFRWMYSKGGHGWIKTTAVDLKTGQSKKDEFLTDDWDSKGKTLGLTSYRPLADFTGLCRTLADTPPDHAGIQAFANRFGPLLGSAGSSIALPHRPSAQGHVLGRGESLDVWHDAIMHLRLVHGIWDCIKRRDVEALARNIRWRDGMVEFESHPDLPKGKLPVAPFLKVSTTIAVEERDPTFFATINRGDVIMPAYRFIQEIINKRLNDCASPRMLWDESRGQMSVRLIPNHLLGAIWLQLALAIERNIEFRRCAECETWFEVSPGSGRSDKVYCSNTCRVKAHRRRHGELAAISSQRKPGRPSKQLKAGQSAIAGKSKRGGSRGPKSRSGNRK